MSRKSRPSSWLCTQNVIKQISSSHVKQNYKAPCFYFYCLDRIYTYRLMLWNYDYDDDDFF